MKEPHKPRFMTQVRAIIRTLNYSLYTERNYVYWIKQFIHYHQLRHPIEMSDNAVNSFLTYLPVILKASVKYNHSFLVNGFSLCLFF
ncbi:phage integrase N-terminal SAM-like domain-containing protein [Aliikangiella maris]|uniref:Phage integrase N-terminal SAM-like domain-containing protein n=2 Tax=Aliikangiella maris TaxID=3162458 RepID=A0ABV2BZ97_9GAMM